MNDADLDVGQRGISLYKSMFSNALSVAGRTAWPGPLLGSLPRVQFRAWVGQQDAVRTVHLAGRLGREHTAELLRICDEAPRPLRVDLANLVSADPTGLEALVGLESRGAELTGTSPYLALRLEHARAAERGGNATPGPPAAPRRAGC